MACESDPRPVVWMQCAQGVEHEQASVRVRFGGLRWTQSPLKHTTTFRPPPCQQPEQLPALRLPCLLVLLPPHPP